MPVAPPVATVNFGPHRVDRLASGGIQVQSLAMKRIVAGLALVVLFIAAYAWFSHRQSPPIATPVAAEDPKRAEREALFGADALKPDVQWRDSGLGYRIIAEGTPPKPGFGNIVRIAYTGRLADGTVFDKPATPSNFTIGTTIPGLSAGLQMLGTGGKAVFFIPPSLAYGSRKTLGIPPNSGLTFEVEVLEIKQ
jgi:FKBP-type peptidyl-prolyl cis-trans isomerase